MNDRCPIECPLIEKIETLENDVRYLKRDSKSNEQAWTKLSRDIVQLSLKIESKDKETIKALKDIKSNLDSHMNEETDVVHEIVKKFDNLSDQLFNPKDGVFTSLRDEVRDNKFKTKVIWGIITSISLSALGVVAYLIRGVI